MPYGLFDYGGTINTMGLSPAYVPPLNSFGFPVLGTGTNADPFRPDTSYKFPTSTGLTNRSLTDMLGGNPYTDRMPEEGNQMSTTPFPNYTLRFPEEGPIQQITTAALREEGPIQQLTTEMVGEEEPNYNPTTLRMPEDGPVPGPVPPTGGTGGCPAGYAPAPPSQYRDPVLPGPRFYDAPIGEGRPIPAPMPILPTSRPRTGSSISFNANELMPARPSLARGFYTG